MGKKKPNFYAVIKGKDMYNDLEYGLFTNWTDCSQHVSGVKGAIFQGFQTFDEAVDNLNFSGLSPILVYVNEEWISEKAFRAKAGISRESESTFSEPEYDADLDENLDTDYFDCDDDELDKTCIINSSDTETSQKSQIVGQTDDCFCVLPKSDTEVNPVHRNIDCMNVESHVTVKPQTDPEETSLKQKVIDDSPTDNLVCAVCSEPCSDSMLKCNGCNLKVHYECTGLPRYEIVKYLGHKSRKFVCEHCTLGIPKFRNLSDSCKMKAYKQCSTALKGTVPIGQKQGSLLDDIKGLSYFPGNAVFSVDCSEQI